VEVTFLEEKKGWMTVEEAGRKGALRASVTHGEEFFSEIGREGGRLVAYSARKGARKKVKNPLFV
jgi:general stress protein YciG